MDYIPTQFLAELIKHEGFDGICYKSGSGKGLNYLLLLSVQCLFYGLQRGALSGKLILR